ncbi:MAG: hypothetical protein JOZ62_18790, partial [Acidobacteriaceae bacterium]|nr:hypothetical protein [Acidobacteriaceae bacterium]
ALLLFASALSGDPVRAQDALQQVFLKLMENGNLSRATDKKAYLFACVRNAILNDCRLQHRNTRVEVVLVQREMENGRSLLVSITRGAADTRK